MGVDLVAFNFPNVDPISLHYDDTQPGAPDLMGFIGPVVVWREPSSGALAYVGPNTDVDISFYPVGTSAADPSAQTLATIVVPGLGGNAFQSRPDAISGDPTNPTRPLAVLEHGPGGPFGVGPIVNPGTTPPGGWVAHPSWTIEVIVTDQGDVPNAVTITTVVDFILPLDEDRWLYMWTNIGVHYRDETTELGAGGPGGLGEKQEERNRQSLVAADHSWGTGTPGGGGTGDNVSPSPEVNIPVVWRVTARDDILGDRNPDGFAGGSTAGAGFDRWLYLYTNVGVSYQDSTMESATGGPGGGGEKQEERNRESLTAADHTWGTGTDGGGGPGDNVDPSPEPNTPVVWRVSARDDITGDRNPDGATNLKSVYLYLYTNIGVGFEDATLTNQDEADALALDQDGHPTLLTQPVSPSPNNSTPPNPGGDQWTSAFSEADGVTRDEDRWLYLYTNVVDCPPCPKLVSILPTVARVGDAITLTGQSFGNPATGGGEADTDFTVFISDVPPTGGGPGCVVPAASDVMLVSPGTFVPGSPGGAAFDSVTVIVPGLSARSALSGFVFVQASDGRLTTPQSIGVNEEAPYTCDTLCDCSPTKFLTVIDIDPEDDAGWWIEAHEVDGTSKIIDTVPVTRASFQKVLNGVGKGSIALSPDAVMADGTKVVPTIIDPDPRTAVELYDAAGARVLPIPVAVEDPPVSTLLRVFLHGVIRYSFFAETISEPYQDKGVTLVTISGEGIESSLKWAVLFPADYPNNPIVAGDFQFIAVSPGTIWTTIFAPTQDPAVRGVGVLALPFHSLTFDGSFDSDNELWDATDLSTFMRRKITYLQSAEHMTTLGFDWDVDDNYRIGLFNSKGIDLTQLADGPTIQEGDIISGGTVTRVLPGRNSVFAEGVAGRWVRQSKPAEQAAIGTREFYLSAQSIGDESSGTSLNRAAITALDQESARSSAVKTKHVRQRAGALADFLDPIDPPDFVDVPTPFIDFDVGDRLYIDLVDEHAGRSITKEEYPEGFRCKAITVQLTEEREIYTVDWNYVALEEDDQVAAILRRLLERNEGLAGSPGSVDPAGGDGGVPPIPVDPDHTHLQADITDLFPIEIGDAASGDLGGTYPAPSVEGWQGAPLTNSPTVFGESVFFDPAGAPGPAPGLVWHFGIIGIPIFDAGPIEFGETLVFTEDAGGAGIDGWTYDTASGGGGGGLTFNTIHTPPSPADILDDEFDDGVISGAWTGFNVGPAVFSESLDGGYLFMTTPGAGGLNVRGLFQTAPPSPYTFTVPVAIGGNLVADGAIGIGFRESATGELHIIEIHHLFDASEIEVAKFSSPTVFVSAVDAPHDSTLENAYFQIENDGADLIFRFGDGVVFTEIFRESVGTFLTPDEVVLALIQVGTNPTRDTEGVFYWSRWNWDADDSLKRDVGGGGGGGVPVDSRIANIYTRPSFEVVNADDQEFATAGPPDGTELTVSGTATWTQRAHLLSGVVAGTSAADMNARIFLGTWATFPVTIDVLMRQEISTENFHQWFLFFSDGVLAADSFFAAYHHRARTFGGTDGTFTSINPAGLSSTAVPYIGVEVYTRVVWTAVNTFRIAWSPDGISYTNFGLGDHAAAAFTPTHFGIGVSNWGNAERSVIAAEYIRITEADLSV